MKKILIAEDDTFLQDLTAEKLIKEGYEVIKTADGDAVIFIVAEEKPDLLLLDVQLPHKTGIEILTELRANPDTASLPVILFTNEAGTEIEAIAKEHNATYFMKALTGSGELVAAIAKTLQ